MRGKGKGALRRIAASLVYSFYPVISHPLFNRRETCHVEDASMSQIQIVGQTPKNDFWRIPSMFEYCCLRIHHMGLSKHRIHPNPQVIFSVNCQKRAIAIFRKKHVAIPGTIHGYPGTPSAKSLRSRALVGAWAMGEDS